MEKPESLLQCYNKGCGKKFDSSINTDDSCCHHPGDPFFHDAYKGWSCCSKKCIDFTEFLNIKGCTLSKHCNIKPIEPVKPVKTVDSNDIIEVKPIVPSVKQRPPFSSPMTVMKPVIAASLQRIISTNSTQEAEPMINGIIVGTLCKNGGCGASYEGDDNDNSICTHHSGVPIFHEGLKYWSCCQKKTTDFNAFLNQLGCQRGKHLWVKEKGDKNTVQCRWDYHQTGSNVVVSIYAKRFCHQSSVIELNPIRLKMSLMFPEEGASTFELDLELKGIIDVEASLVNMYGTKVEIILKKAEAGSWSRLEVPREQIREKSSSNDVEITQQKFDAVDLDNI